MSTNYYDSIAIEYESSSDSIAQEDFIAQEDLSTPTISLYFIKLDNSNMAEQQQTFNATSWNNLKKEMLQSMRELNESLTRSIRLMSDDLSKSLMF